MKQVTTVQETNPVVDRLKHTLGVRLNYGPYFVNSVHEENGRVRFAMPPDTTLYAVKEALGIADEQVHRVNGHYEIALSDVNLATSVVHKK